MVYTLVKTHTSTNRKEAEMATRKQAISAFKSWIDANNQLAMVMIDYLDSFDDATGTVIPKDEQPKRKPGRPPKVKQEELSTEVSTDLSTEDEGIVKPSPLVEEPQIELELAAPLEDEPIEEIEDIFAAVAAGLDVPPLTVKEIIETAQEIQVIDMKYDINSLGEIYNECRKLYGTDFEKIKERIGFKGNWKDLYARTELHDNAWKELCLAKGEWISANE